MPYLCLWRRNFCVTGECFFSYSGAIFERPIPFLLTTAAQNMHDLRRKLLLLGNHFFGWLKTENFSNACGTTTLKSPPPRGSDAPHVHPRLRKPLARCTLDCGSKTSESPALRGFVAERVPIRGTSLYLVLKSNGLRHPKNLPVKFGFSPIGISQILPKSYRYNAVPNRFSSRFSTSRTNGPRSLSLPKAGIHTRSSEKDRTQRLTRRNRGLPSLGHSVALRCQ